jgi:hypothetical protein
MTATFTITPQAPIGTVTRKALIARINGKLKADGRRIRKNRGGWMLVNFGEYCVFSKSQNRVFEHHIDIAELAVRLGVMDAWERIAEPVAEPALVTA